MAKKYYAVAKGRVAGIYLSWAECKKQIDHFSGAVYKSFPTEEEAKEFIELASGGKETIEKKETDNIVKAQQVSTKDHLVAYVDGSYEHSQRKYAYGCALVFQDDVVTLNGSGEDQDYVSMRNVAGEILGSEQAINWAIEHGFSQVTIFYDYEGIEKWANGIWKANKPGTQRYQQFVKEKRENITISFQKVAAHTGVLYNEMADQLAKQALGL